MQRYFLNEQTKDFYKDDLHHIKNVMRFKTGDNVVLCFDSKCYQAQLTIDNNVTYEIVKQLEEEKSLDITIVQGNLKGTKLDEMIKYATIFGAKEIIITNFDRSIAKLKNIETKYQRYFKIAKEAAELSRRFQIPKITFIEKLKTIDYQKYDILLLADEDEEITYLTNINNFNEKNKICLVVGPEGGISNNERIFFKTNNFTAISFGKYIYPAEIAAISALITLNNKLF